MQSHPLSGSNLEPSGFHDVKPNICSYFNKRSMTFFTITTFFFFSLNSILNKSVLVEYLIKKILQNWFIISKGYN